MAMHPTFADPATTADAAAADPATRRHGLTKGEEDERMGAVGYMYMLTLRRILHLGNLRQTVPAPEQKLLGNTNLKRQSRSLYKLQSNSKKQMLLATQHDQQHELP